MELSLSSQLRAPSLTSNRFFNVKSFFFPLQEITQSILDLEGTQISPNSSGLGYGGTEFQRLSQVPSSPPPSYEHVIAEVSSHPERGRTPITIAALDRTYVSSDKTGPTRKPGTESSLEFGFGVIESKLRGHQSHRTEEGDRNNAQVSQGVLQGSCQTVGYHLQNE